jgi:CheY-like chemotaxis protein
LSLIDENFGSAAVAQTSGPTDARRGEGKVPETPADAAIDAAQGVVLMVDDVEANRDVLSRQLRRQGYAVIVAASGQAALDHLRTSDVDLVLLDIMMPEMDGYEVLQRLKADPALRHIPVIMISALSELDSVVRCLELGAEDYLPKPFNPTLLKARLGASLDKKRARDREQQLAAAVRAQNTEMAAWRKAQEADLAVARTTQQGIVNAAQPPLTGWHVETIYKPLIQVEAMSTAGADGPWFLSFLGGGRDGPWRGCGAFHHARHLALQPRQHVVRHSARRPHARERRILHAVFRTFSHDRMLRRRSSEWPTLLRRRWPPAALDPAAERIRGGIAVAHADARP